MLILVRSLYIILILSHYFLSLSYYFSCKDKIVIIQNVLTFLFAVHASLPIPPSIRPHALHHVCEGVFVVKPDTLQRPGSDVTARVTGSPSLISLYYKVRGQGRLVRPRGRVRTRLLKHACLRVSLSLLFSGPICPSQLQASNQHHSTARLMYDLSGSGSRLGSRHQSFSSGACHLRRTHDFEMEFIIQQGWALWGKY